LKVFKDNNLNWLDPIDSYIIAVTNRMFSFPHEGICGFDSNDKLGRIIEFYNPVGYGAGVHTIKSNEGDITLRYTITVTPPSVN
jgi:hypothetical protein